MYYVYIASFYQTNKRIGTETRLIKYAKKHKLMVKIIIITTIRMLSWVGLWFVIVVFSWPGGYKTFSMLNSAEQQIYPAHKCYGILPFINIIHTTLVSILVFYEQLKFRA